MFFIFILVPAPGLAPGARRGYLGGKVKVSGKNAELIIVFRNTEEMFINPFDPPVSQFAKLLLMLQKKKLKDSSDKTKQDSQQLMAAIAFSELQRPNTRKQH